MAALSQDWSGSRWHTCFSNHRLRGSTLKRIKQKTKDGHPPTNAKRYSAEFRIEAVKLALQMGIKQAAEKLRMPYGSLFFWIQKAVAPMTGPYCVANMLPVVREAYRIAEQTGKGPHYAILIASKPYKLNWDSLKVMIWMENVPAIPGFDFYDDPDVQARCLALGRGERLGGNPLADLIADYRRRHGTTKLPRATRRSEESIRPLVAIEV